MARGPQEYMKAVKAHLEKSHPDSVKTFETGATAYVKKIVTNFKDYDFVSLAFPSSSPFLMFFSTLAKA